MRKAKVIGVILLALVLGSCKEHTEYNQPASDSTKAQKAYLSLVDKESKRKERFDSVFYGICFRMPASVFYERCTEMFKKKIFTGSYDYQVVVTLHEPFKRTVQLSFYPTFDKPFVSKVLCKFSYPNASIFKKEDRSDVLIKELVPAMMSWYKGNQFIAMPSQNPLKGPSYIKVDANRKIAVSEDDNGTDVDVVYEDMKPAN